MGALDPLTHRVLPAEAPAHLAPQVDLPVEAKAPRPPVPRLSPVPGPPLVLCPAGSIAGPWLDRQKRRVKPTNRPMSSAAALSPTRAPTSTIISLERVRVRPRFKEAR